jgi:hypothetical protein
LFGFHEHKRLIGSKQYNYYAEEQEANIQLTTIVPIKPLTEKSELVSVLKRMEYQAQEYSVYHSEKDNKRGIQFETLSDHEKQEFS